MASRPVVWSRLRFPRKVGRLYQDPGRGNRLEAGPTGSNPVAAMITAVNGYGIGAPIGVPKGP